MTHGFSDIAIASSLHLSSYVSYVRIETDYAIFFFLHETSYFNLARCESITISGLLTLLGIHE